MRLSYNNIVGLDSVNYTEASGVEVASEAFYMYNSMSMRRAIITAVIALVGIVAMPESATAQFDLSKIGSMLGSKVVSKPTKSPYQTLAEEAPSKSKVFGVWSYSDFDIEYLGNNTLASTAISQAEYYLQQEIVAAGITSGCYSITLRSNGKGCICYGDYTYECSYSYNATNAHVDIEVKLNNATVECSGFIKMKDGKLGLMLNAEDVVKTVATIAPEAMNDQTYLMVKSVVDSFPGIYITTYYCKQ